MWRNQEAQRNLRNKAYERGLDPCEFCGRGVRPDQGWWVHAIDGGHTLIDLSEQYVPDAGDMGWWILGPECGKQIPKEFRSKNLGGK